MNEFGYDQTRLGNLQPDELNYMNQKMYSEAPTRFAVLYDWMTRGEAWNFTITNLLSMTAYMQATDPKDMVYIVNTSPQKTHSDCCCIFCILMPSEEFFIAVYECNPGNKSPFY